MASPSPEPLLASRVENRSKASAMRCGGITRPSPISLDRAASGDPAEKSAAQLGLDTRILVHTVACEALEIWRHLAACTTGDLHASN